MFSEKRYIKKDSALNQHLPKRYNRFIEILHAKRHFDYYLNGGYPFSIAITFLTCDAEKGRFSNSKVIIFFRKLKNSLLKIFNSTKKASRK